MKRARSPGSTGESMAPNHIEAFVSVKTLAANWDCSRTTVSRLLETAGIQAYYLGSGRNGSKRYLKADVDQFLQSVAREDRIGSFRRTPGNVGAARPG